MKATVAELVPMTPAALEAASILADAKTGEWLHIDREGAEIKPLVKAFREAAARTPRGLRIVQRNGELYVSVYEKRARKTAVAPVDRTDANANASKTASKTK